jgi:hypothetical protein
MMIVQSKHWLFVQSNELSFIEKFPNFMLSSSDNVEKTRNNSIIFILHHIEISIKFNSIFST